MKKHSLLQLDNTGGIVLSWVILILMILLASPLQADTNDRDFDHFSTGFPLSGAHTRVDCETCHKRGVFKGTPKQCGACHNGRISEGKSTNHIASSDNCDDCHTTFSWDTNAVDHSSVMGPCKTCHQTPRNHIEINNAPCDSCHNTLSWDAARVDHNNLGGKACTDCHALPRNHISISGGSRCDDCHDFNRNWDNVVKVDHTAVVGSCESCHDGKIAIGKPLTGHPDTTEPCATCHSTENWNASNHEGVTGDCQRCHGVTAVGKGPNHIASTNICENCHNNFNSFSPVTVSAMDHGEVIGTCASCHQKDKDNAANHPTTTAACDDCHGSTTSFTANVRFDHTGVVGACSSCHSKDKPGQHFDGECNTCHITTGWGRISYSHSSGNYPGNHNSGVTCLDCHSNYGDANWTSPIYKPFCAGCHERNFRREGAHIGGSNGTVEQNKNCGASGCHRVSSRGF